MARIGLLGWFKSHISSVKDSKSRERLGGLRLRSKAPDTVNGETKRAETGTDNDCAPANTQAGARIAGVVCDGLGCVVVGEPRNVQDEL